MISTNIFQTELRIASFSERLLSFQKAVVFFVSHFPCHMYWFSTVENAHLHEHFT